MSYEQKSKQLFFWGLNIYIISCLLLQCKATDGDDPSTRFFENLSELENEIESTKIFQSWPEFQNIQKMYCDVVCGRTRFAFSSVLRAHCTKKCPNSPLANQANSTTTTPAPSSQSTTVASPTTVSMAAPSGSSTTTAAATTAAAVTTTVAPTTAPTVASTTAAAVTPAPAATPATAPAG